MSGGGGTSGTVDFPPYMKNTHSMWFGISSDGNLTSVQIDSNETITQLLKDAINNNPFADSVITSPENSLQQVEDEWAVFKDAVNGINPTTDWETFLNKASTELNKNVNIPQVPMVTIMRDARISAGVNLTEATKVALEAIDNGILEHVRKAFENRADRSRIRAINRFAGGMLDINAVNGSAFILGMALIEGQHMESVNDFDANMSAEILRGGMSYQAQVFSTEVASRVQAAIEERRTRGFILNQAIQSMQQVLIEKINYKEAVTKTLAEAKRFRIVATQEYEGSELDLDEKYATWGFNSYMKTANVLASITGASAALPDRPNRAQSVLGGVMGGASAGAAFGAPGIAGGALIGGLAGLIE